MQLELDRAHEQAGVAMREQQQLREELAEATHVSALPVHTPPHTPACHLSLARVQLGGRTERVHGHCEHAHRTVAR